MAQQAIKVIPTLERLLAAGPVIISPGNSSPRLQPPRTPSKGTFFPSPDMLKKRRPMDSSLFLSPRGRGSPLLKGRIDGLGLQGRNPQFLSPHLHSRCTPVKNPSPGQGDRFIPNRSKLNVERSRFLLLSRGSPKIPSISLTNDDQSPRVLPLTSVSPKACSMKENTAGTSPFRTSVKECKSPKQVLDAPNLVPDQSLFILDWSAKSVIALALGEEVYLWNSLTRKVVNLCKTTAYSYITVLKWTSDGEVLAIASSDGRINCWLEESKEVVVLLEHRNSVTSVAWNGRKLASGNLCGRLVHYDLDSPDPSEPTSTVRGHRLSVTGLNWNKSGRLLASACVDGLIKIWAVNNTRTPLHVLEGSAGRVQAVDWCPWMNSILAVSTGAGQIRVFKVSTGQTSLSSAVDDDSPITDLKWCVSTKELVSSHCKGVINIWSFPALVNTRRLKGHEGCVLCFCLDSNAVHLASVGVDEVLRIWTLRPETQDKADTIPTSRLYGHFLR